MTLKQLEYFYHVCDDPHLINSSKKLGISQPAISLALKALEEELQEQLFSRIGKKLVLNERGRRFREQRDLFQVQIKNLSFTRDLFIVYYKNRYQTRLFREFIAFVKKRFTA